MITLTSSPPPSSNGYFCPGSVQFTCVGTEINELRWKINNTNSGIFLLLDEVMFPLPLSWSPPLPDVTITITNASFGGSGQNIESTLNANVSDLRGTLIKCLSTVNNIVYESNTTVQEIQGTL